MPISLQAVLYIRRIVFDSLQGERIGLISKASRLAIRPTQHPIQCVRSSLGVKSPRREADQSPHWPKLRMNGSIAPLLILFHGVHICNTTCAFMIHILSVPFTLCLWDAEINPTFSTPFSCGQRERERRLYLILRFLGVKRSDSDTDVPNAGSPGR